MSQAKPFHRNFRGFVDGSNSGYSSWGYIHDRDYAQSPEHYVRAFLLIQKDLQSIFEFIEPSDTNVETYSFRIHELFMRTCIEVEANFKAILKENIFNPVETRGKNKGKPIDEKYWNIKHYRKINITHHLSSYKVHVPIWTGKKSMFEPFKEWPANDSLSWYQAYNRCKHDRYEQFKEANLLNLVSAIAGLVALLSSQFGRVDFSPASTVMSLGGYSYYSTEPALGDFFHIEFPGDWTIDEKYDFDWGKLQSQPDRFQKINYDTI